MMALRPTDPDCRALPVGPSDNLPLPARLHVTLRCSNLTCQLALAGALDRDSAVALATQFEQLDRSGFDVVVIDLSELTHVDESGAVALAELWAHLRAGGLTCEIRGLPPRIGTCPLDLLLALRASHHDGAGDTGPVAAAPRFLRGR